MSQQGIGPQRGMRLTRAGWLALVLSLSMGLGLAVGLKVWWPEKFAPTHRHDPRHQATPIPFLMIPLVAGGLAVLFWYLGYPVLRYTDPKETGERKDGTGDQAGL